MEMPELLKPDELAKLLKIPLKPGVYDLVSQRKIPFIKVGGRLRFNKKDVLEYLNQNRVEVIR